MSEIFYAGFIPFYLDVCTPCTSYTVPMSGTPGTTSGFYVANSCPGASFSITATGGPSSIIDALEADVDARAAADGTSDFACYTASAVYYATIAGGDFRLSAWYEITVSMSRASHLDPYEKTWWFFHSVFQDEGDVGGSGTRITLEGDDYPTPYISDPPHTVVLSYTGCFGGNNARPDGLMTGGTYTLDMPGETLVGASYEWVARSDITTDADMAEIFPSLSADFGCA